MESGNLYQDIPAQLPEEAVNVIAHGRGMRIERIVSRGHRSPPGFWYDQSDDEWVLVLKGEARLRFEKDGREVHLGEGNYINIRAHDKHRVEWTAENAETIWLVVFY